MTKLEQLHGASIPAPRKRGHAFIGEGPINADGKHKARLRPKKKTKRKAKQKAAQNTTQNARRKSTPQLTRKQKEMQFNAWLRQLSAIRKLHKNDEAEPTMLGGMKSSGIKTKSTYTHTPVDDEKPEEQRHAIWQPPQTDKSRFSGTSSSRHKATASYKVGADYETIAYDDEYKDSKPGEKEKKKGKGKKNKKKRKAKGKAKGQGGSAAQSSPKATGSKKQQKPVTTAPLSAQEKKAFDSNFRIYGGDPSWKGWDNKVIPGRTRRFLFSQVHVLGLDKPDDKKWTKGEKTVFRRHRGILSPSSPKWKTLLPRKSEQAIKKAYADRLT